MAMGVKGRRAFLWIWRERKKLIESLPVSYLEVNVFANQYDGRLLERAAWCLFCHHGIFINTTENRPVTDEWYTRVEDVSVTNQAFCVCLGVMGNLLTRWNRRSMAAETSYFVTFCLVCQYIGCCEFTFPAHAQTYDLKTITVWVRTKRKIFK